MKDAEQQRIKNKEMKEKSAQFQPNIGNANSVLSKSKRHRHRYHFEDAQQRYERLAFHEKELIKRKTQLIAKELHKNDTFKPKINKKSSKMGRPSSVYELFQPEKSKKLQRQIEEEAEKILKAQHPFEPVHKLDLVMVK